MSVVGTPTIMKVETLCHETWSDRMFVSSSLLYRFGDFKIVTVSASCNTSDHLAIVMNVSWNVAVCSQCTCA